ncbi:MAG: hypothetical protein ACFN4V_01250, partial [Prevotella denticola]
MRFIASNRGLVHIDQLFKIIIAKHLLSHHSWHAGANSLYWDCKGLNVEAYIMFSESNLTLFMEKYLFLLKKTISHRKFCFLLLKSPEYMKK